MGQRFIFREKKTFTAPATDIQLSEKGFTRLTQHFSLQLALYIVVFFTDESESIGTDCFWPYWIALLQNFFPNYGVCTSDIGNLIFVMA